MSEPTYPAFRTGKDIEVRFAPSVGVISCKYNQILRALGKPTFSVENNDSFDGTETAAWHIQFQSGESAILAENREFGYSEDSYEISKTWKVNTRFPKTYEWVKQLIRDANPNG
jgi:hypothetical protein